jgi:hypothetical protein
MEKRLWIPIALVVLVAGVQSTSTLTSDPMAALRHRTLELGYAMDDLDVLVGGYSSGALSMEAEGRFRSRSRPELGEIRIAVERALPFTSWRLVSHTCQGGDR